MTQHQHPRASAADVHDHTDDEWVDDRGRPIEDHDRGLLYDIRTLVGRRRALGILGGLGVAGALAACGADATTGVTGASTSASGTGTSSGSSSSSTSSASVGSLVEAPDETAGPYPGDGSNGQNVLDDSGIVRRDIRSSFGSSTTTAGGVPFTIRLTVKDVATSSALVGAAVYAWHCDREGRYSLYSSGVEQENYLRGVQATDGSGTATFTSVFPACYSGRWPHVHFEVYANVADATASGPIVKTSQIALPKAACDAVYATSGYEQSVSNLSQLSLETDNVFRDDGAVHQLATMSGDVSTGYTATLIVGV